MMKTKTGLYIHIPFCAKKCNYCDFCSFSNVGESVRSKYIEKLCQEIDSYKAKNVIVDTIFFGGGTPTLLTAKEFANIVDHIKEAFLIDDNVEFTVEANPGTTDRQKLVDFVKCGVNRFSIGLQSIHEKELKKLGRIHDFGEFKQTYLDLKSIGIDNVNIDLMYGIPYQTLESFEKTLDVVLNLIPEHLSVYGLILEEGTPFYSEQDTLDLPGEDLECDMYFLAAKKLAEKGYIHYEVSNYSKAGKESRHNLKYWHCNEYIGIGVSAHSYFENKRYSNTDNICDYINDTSQMFFSEQLDVDTQKYEYVMLALRLKRGFSLSEYYSRFSENFLAGREEFIEKMVSLGYINLIDDNISLTEKGFYVSNSILSELL